MAKYTTASHDVFITPHPSEPDKFQYRWVALNPVDIFPTRRNFDIVVDGAENSRILDELEKMVAEGLATKE